MFPRHILSSDQFSRKYLEALFRRAQTIGEEMGDRTSRASLRKRLNGHLMFSMFYEPSTRTRFSFGAAAFHLGMDVKGTDNAAEFSSAIKGESIEDSTKVLCGYLPSVIVIRHYEAGAAARAASVSSVPIINAGDGGNEHPTQTVLDLYTIQSELGLVDGLKIVMGGDLANGRTIRSLAKVLSNFDGIEIVFISPPELAIKNDLKAFLIRHKMKFSEITELDPYILHDANVVYWTRIQKERFEQIFLVEGVSKDEAAKKAEQLYHKVYDRFIITPDTMNLFAPDAILMHPLPRVNEIETDVDLDQRAAYFRQSANGLPVRMAILEDLILNE